MMYQAKVGEIILGSRIKVATNFFSRLRGLMFVKSLTADDGLLIRSCNSIHTCFMRFNIDVLFLNNDLEIVKIRRDMRPWRMTLIYWSATQVLELPAGRLGQEIKTGNKVEIRCIN